MTPLRQLLRQPVRLLVVFLLLGLASAFFCLSAGVFASAQATLAQVEESYVTIGVPTTETKDVETQYNGLTLHHEESVITDEMWKYLDGLAAEGTIIEGGYRQNYISAYSSSLQSVTSGRQDGKYVPALDDPYDRAIFVVRVVSAQVDPPMEGIDLVNATVTAEIETAVKLHPDYELRNNLRFTVSCNSRDELDALDIVPGKRYLIYSADYIDLDLELRTTIAGDFRCDVSDIDLSRLSYELTAEEMMTEHPDPDFKPVAKYATEDKTMLLSQKMLNQMNACHLTVNHFNGMYPDDRMAVGIDGTETDIPLNECYLDVYMTPLDTELDTFLKSDEGVEWLEAIHELDVQYHSVSVIGTDLLESMYCFHQGDAFVTEGRSFTDAEYEKGACVCLISESTAMASGLGVGEKIDLSFYWGPDPLADITAPEWKLQPQPYSQRGGLMGGTQEYEIVGVYRQSNLWDTADYRFLPNTVFVPNASLPENCYTSRNGVFFTYVLQNGKIPALQDALTSQDYPANILFCFDNGYSEITETLHGFYCSTVQLLGAACLTAVAALFVFLALFVNRQRRTVGLMLSLGSGKRAAIQFSWRVAALPAVFAATAGIIVGILTMNVTARSLLSSASEVLNTSLSSSGSVGFGDIGTKTVSMPVAVIAAGVMQMAVCSAAAYLYLRRLAHKSPLDLIRKG